MTANEFLALEQRRAIEGIERAASDIAHEIEGAIDLAGTVRRHPLLVLGGGAVAGFLLGRFAPASSMGTLVAAVRGPLIRGVQMLLAAELADKAARPPDAPLT